MPGEVVYWRNSSTPTMTSNTTPAPYVCSASHNNSSAYVPFRNDTSTGQWWSVVNPGEECWLKFDFNTPTVCDKALVIYSSSNLSTSKLQASNDDSNWVDLGSFGSRSHPFEVFTNNTTAYRYYRFYTVYLGSVSGTLWVSRMQLALGKWTPLIGTEDAKSIYNTKATLVAKIWDDGGDPCSVSFFYHAAGSSTWIQTTPTPYNLYIYKTVTETITGLTRNTLYYYYAHIQNSVYHGDGLVKTFTTTDLDTPVVITQDATDILKNGAVLNGYLEDDGGEDCSCGFDYGLTTEYEKSVYSGTKNSEQSFDELVGNLKANTVYHFRAKAANHEAIGYGEDKTFMTSSRRKGVIVI